MTVLTVLLLILLWLRLTALILQVLAMRAPVARKQPPAFDPCLEPYVLRRPGPVSPEGELAARLTAGTIDRLQYQREMAVLAAAKERT